MRELRRRVLDGSSAHLIDFNGEADHCLTCQTVPLSGLTLSV